MPEAPEVRQFASFLRRNLHEIHTVSGSTAAFVDDLPLKITEIITHGKILWMVAGEWFIICQFGLTGSWEWLKTTKYTPRILFNKKIAFVDPRGFGRVTFTRDIDRVVEHIRAPDVYEIDKRTFVRDFKKRAAKKPQEKLVVALMDQKFLAGIGNYLSSEILWCARISPHRRLIDIDDPGRVFNCMKRSIKSGIKRVYRQDRDPNGKKIRKEQVNGRTKYWVPGWQA